MTDIEKGNVAIAEFMEVDDIVKYGFDTDGKSFLNYEKSWNALMPAWKKFYDEIYESEMWDKLRTEELDFKASRMIFSIYSVNIESAFYWFNELLTWYNNYKDNQQL